MTSIAAYTVPSGRERIELEQRVRSFYEDYAICLDEKEFDRWPTFFSEDGTYQIISRENFDRGLPMSVMSCQGRGMLMDRVTALVDVLVYQPRIWRRLLSSVKISAIEQGQISSSVNFVLYESMLDSEPQLNMVGRCYDQLIEEGDAFRIRERRCVYDNYRILTSLYVPV